MMINNINKIKNIIYQYFGNTYDNNNIINIKKQNKKLIY